MIDKSFPLTDLHRHLDGNIRPQTILELGLQNNVALPVFELERLKPYVQIVEKEPSLVAFLKKLDLGVAVLADYDACRRVAYENVEDLLREGIDYAELRFSPSYMGMTHKLHPQGVVEAIIDGVTAGSRDFGVKTNLIGIMSRTFGAEQCRDELEACLAFRHRLVAIDLAGDEQGFPGELFNEHFRRVRDAGLHVTVHAGEAAGPESIWQAIRDLGAERIGHGVNSTQDPHLIDYLVENQIGVETCLTSNIQTTTVASLQAHPIRQFLASGMLVSLNTDDPAVEGIDLQYEYNVAAPATGLTKHDVRVLQKNGLKMAFLSENEKIQLIAKVKNKILCSEE